jgi:hypothetical protein
MTQKLYTPVLAVSVLLACAVLAAASCLDGDTTDCKSGTTLFPNDYDPGRLKNITVVTCEPVGSVLKVTPNKWSAAEYRLDGRPGRVDFSAYSTLEFKFRSVGAEPGNPVFTAKTWNRRSGEIAVRDYIEGGVIDETFRLARIPISALQTDKWDLGNVESLEWRAQPAGGEYYVGDIVLRRTRGPEMSVQGKLAPFPESATVLRVTFHTRLRACAARDPRRYRLTSPSDDDYATAVHPVDVGRRVWVEGFGPSGVPRVRESAFLKFAEPLKNGHPYILRVEGVEDEFCNSMTPVEMRFVYDDRELENPNVKVNQEGYKPEGPKIGYVGGYCGDLGGGSWIVGDAGTAVFLDRTFRAQEFPRITDATLRAVSGSREDFVYAVGDRGVIVKWDGATWKTEASGTDVNLCAVDVGPTGVAWAVGEQGICVRNEGDGWTQITTPVKTTLRGVRAVGARTAYAVGDHGCVVRFHEGCWRKEDSGVTSDLFAVAGAGERGPVWAFGAKGAIIERAHGKWRAHESSVAESNTLRCAVIAPDGALWVGGDAGLLLKKHRETGFELVSGAPAEDVVGFLVKDSRNVRALGSHGLLRALKGAPRESRIPSAGLVLRAACSQPYGALRLPAPLPLVSVLRVSTGEKVLETPLKLEVANWELSGEDVHSFDFSALTAPGTYRAHVPGVGVSAAFRVGNDALGRAARTVSRALYYQRCGVALESPWADERFSRPACHDRSPEGRQMDAMRHPSAGSLLHVGESPGSFKDASGGRHDAGDYGKYTPTLVAALWYLFTAYDMDASKFPDNAWNIPESGNRIPDLLDETRRDVELLMKLQEEDGGVHHKVSTEKWFEGTPQDDPGPRYLYAKTTHDTASAAAVLAAAARLWRPYDKVTADCCLARAGKAWAWLKRRPDPEPMGGFRNPPGTVTGEYRDEDDEDNRLWAAAELYRTTGEREFGAYIESRWKTVRDRPFGWIPWRDFYRNAFWAYLRTDRLEADKRIQSDIRRRLLREADVLVRRTYENPYRNAARLDVREWIGWGAFTQSAQYSFTLLQALFLTGDAKYRDAALLNLDAQLGANPLSICFITGLGSRSPQHPLHHPSIHGKSGAPVPGLPVFGPAAHLRNDNRFNAAAQSDENCWPPSAHVYDPLPVLRRYVDAHELVGMSEFTIEDIAVTAAALSLMSESPQDRGTGRREYSKPIP